jgi:multidrug resistance efflux pump
LHGYLEPVNPLEVRIRPEAYGGDLTIVSVAADGAAVKTGDVLLAIDSKPLQKQLAAAKNDLAVAQANADKAEADAGLAAQQDALALRQHHDDLQHALDAVKWWEAVDGPQMLTELDMSVKQAKAAVDDGQDELDQLKKMYKTEELTNATADIVVKRALRSLEMDKIRLDEILKSADKTRRVDYPIAHQHVIDAAESAQLAFNDFQNTQKQQQVQQEAAVVTSRAALVDAKKKVADLAADAEKLTVKAPFDGVVAYGSFASGSFTSDPRALRPGEKAAPQQMLMLEYRPGQLSAHVDIPEAQVLDAHPGMAATLKPAALPGVVMHGVCRTVAHTPSGSASGATFTATFDIGDVDPRLVPGSHVDVHLETSSTTQP